MQNMTPWEKWNITKLHTHRWFAFEWKAFVLFVQYLYNIINYKVIKNRLVLSYTCRPTGYFGISFPLHCMTRRPILSFVSVIFSILYHVNLVLHRSSCHHRFNIRHPLIPSFFTTCEKLVCSANRFRDISGTHRTARKDWLSDSITDWQLQKRIYQ